jgi:hypothetical protein
MSDFGENGAKKERKGEIRETVKKVKLTNSH